VSHDGRYVFVSERNNNALIAFRRDAETGTLTFVESLSDGSEQIDGLSSANAIALAGGFIMVQKHGASNFSIPRLPI
jgi:hypothetical protein